MSTSSSPPLEAPSPAQTNHSNSTTTVASSTTMPVTITTSTTAAQSTGSNSTSSNSVSSSLLNSKGKTNLLANHLAGASNLPNNLNATIIEQANGNGSQNYCLKWNLYTTNLIRNLTEMVAAQQIVDVTIACDGSSIRAHKIILSACSNYFKELFLANPCKHPIVILKDVRINEMRAIVDFMYKGEVNVAQSQLSSLLKTAEILRVKGLTEVTTASGVDIEAILIADEREEREPSVNHSGVLMNKLAGLDSAVAAVAASLNGKILSNGLSNYDGLHQQNDLANSGDPLYNSNLLNLASLSSLRMNNNLNNLNSLNNSTNTLLNLRESAQSELLKRRKKRKKGGYYYSNKGLTNNHSSQDGDQAISLVTNKEGSENNENSSNSCNSSNNSTDNSTINNSLRNLCYIKKEQALADQGNQSDCDNYSGDESNDTLKRTKDLLNVIAAAGAFQGSSVANFYRSSTPESNNQSLLAIRRKLMQQQLSTLSPKGAQDLPDDSDGSNWLQSKRMVEASLIESYEDNEEEMIDVRPIVSLDEGSSSVPTNFNSDQMAVMNSLDINSMTSNSPGLQSGKICVCKLCHITFTAHSSLRRHMQRHDIDRERYQCEICMRTYSRKDYLKEHKKLKHPKNVPNSHNIAAN